MKVRGIVSIIAAAAVIAGATGAATTHRASAASPAYNLILNWFPEPEEGGFYEAQRLGLYQKAGVNSSINEFGFSISPEVNVLQGKAAFGMGNADEILQFNSRGAKLVAILGTFQTNVQGILWHAEDKTVNGLADFSNHTLIYSFGAGYEPYLVLKYQYKNFKTKNNDFTSRAFAANPKAVNQCFVTSEPFRWSKQGLKVKYALIANSGYNPYGSIIFTTQDMVNKHPDAVRAFVKASVQGWYSYLKDSKATNTYMLSAAGAKNYPMKPDEQNFSYSQLVRLHLINGGDAATHGIGWFNVNRWKTLQQQMVAVGQKVGSVDL
ncbi:MAG: ssuA, partial [Chloroflexi bacterium]|nr:ssuA [Chloroflexota bacterium]